MKKLAVDAGPLISLSGSCLIDIFGKLRERLGARFLITPAVAGEAIENPLRITRFSLSAMRVRKALEEGWLEEIPLSQKSVAFSKEVQETANHLFFANAKPIRLVHQGEAESIALLKQEGCRLFAVDERTTRMLFEQPLDLKLLIERRQNIHLSVSREALERFRKLLPPALLVRSAELLGWAFEEGLLGPFNSKQGLWAALFSVKFGGCALSTDEIEQFVEGLP